MYTLTRVGQFLRILDENGYLSITNISVVAVLIKLIIAPDAGLVETGGLLITLMTYSHKKHLSSKKEQ